MEPKDYWRIFRAHWIAIIVITVAGGLVSIGWAFIQPKVYSASASGILTTGVNSDIDTATIAENYAKSRVKSYVDIATSVSVAQIAAKELGINDSSNDLLQRISVANPLNTATMKVTAEADTAENARDLAEAWVKAIGQKVSEIENSGRSESEQANQSIVTFKSLDAAILPRSPIFPNNKLALAIGLLAGAAIACAYALLRNTFDRRVHSVEEVERETGVAVIGTIPLYKGFTQEKQMLESNGGNDNHGYAREEYAIAESLRELRTNLQFMNIDNPPRKIVITSALPAEGKSTVISNLASTIAASGQTVVVIDGDLRRPMVAKTFGLLEGVGLTDVLIGQAELGDVLQQWGPTGKLFVLGAGKIPPNPSELLASKAVHDLIDHLAEHAMVLIDAPPLLPVTDAAILTARTDGAIIVTRANRTTYDEVKSTLENITKVQGRVLGIVLNVITGKTIGGDGYGYRYRSYYGRVQEARSIPSSVHSEEFDVLLNNQGDGGPAASKNIGQPVSADETDFPGRRARRVSEH